MKGLLSRAALVGASVAAIRAAIAGAAATRNGQQAPLTSEREKIAHLLRRAGFGYSADDLQAYTSLGLQGAIDRLVDFQGVTDDVEDRLTRAQLDLAKAADMQRWWLLRMMYSKRPLQEKMTLFWHGLLVSGAQKVGLPRPTLQLANPPNLMLDQNKFFREHALDDFGTIMKGISRDPAMVVYLDSLVNRKGSPNENYAREVMELFTLGIVGPDGTPNYSEDDVRQAARAFTGWGLNRERQFQFLPAQHDTGPKTIFGKTGNFNGDDVIDLIMQHPSSAWYISRRLFAFFAYDNPEPEVLAPIVQAFKDSGGSIRAAVRAIFGAPAFYSERAYRAKVKAPAELVAGMARALQLETDAFTLNAAVTAMSQTLFNPPNVAGWPGGASWFTTSTWLYRVNFANRLLSNRGDPHTKPVAMAAMMQQRGLNTPEKLVDWGLDLLLDGQVLPEQRQTLLSYVKDGVTWPAPGQPLQESDPAIDEKARGLLYLVMAMPEYQLA